MMEDKKGWVDNTYHHIPDELKKKSGRPRKYVCGYTPKDPEEKREFEKVDLEQNFLGQKIVQLDYYTLQYIDEYPSIKAFADDYGVSVGSCSSALKKAKNGIAYIHAHELFFMRKEVYDMVKESFREQI